MGYLLDTNIISFALKAESPEITRKISLLGADVCISSITWYELQHGVAHLLAKSGPTHRAIKMAQLVNNMKSTVNILEFSTEDAEATARLQAVAASAGHRLSVQDTLIAGHALSRGHVLVSHDCKAQFGSLTSLGLLWEDWS